MNDTMKSYRSTLGFHDDEAEASEPLSPAGGRDGLDGGEWLAAQRDRHWLPRTLNLLSAAMHLVLNSDTSIVFPRASPRHPPAAGVVRSGIMRARLLAMGGSLACDLSVERWAAPGTRA
jgi:hypothetical protein